MGKASGGKEQRRSYKRSRPELLEKLRERLTLLNAACVGFDHEGRFAEALHLAVGLRILLHDTRTSVSIFRQLGVKDELLFEDTCGPYPAGLLVDSGRLAMLSTDPGRGDDWVPLYERRSPPGGRIAPQPFDRWWTECVLMDEAKRQFSRKRLVLKLSDQDGGAHVDPELAEDYAALSRGNSLGWARSTSPMPDAPSTPLSSPVPASVRQIAHEVIRSCQWWLEDALTKMGDDPQVASDVVSPLATYRTPFRAGRTNWPIELTERPPEGWAG